MDQDLVIDGASTVSTNRQLASILRRLAIHPLTRGGEYDNYLEILSILHTLSGLDGLLSIKLALPGSAGFIAPYFDFFPLQQLTEAAFFADYLAPRPDELTVFPSAIAPGIRPARTDSFILATRLVNWDANNRTLGYLLLEVDANVLLRPLQQYEIPGQSSLKLVAPNLVLFQKETPDANGGANNAADRTEFAAPVAGIDGQLTLVTPSRQPSERGQGLAMLQLLTAAVLSLASVTFALYLAGSLNQGVQHTIQSIRLIEGGQFSAVETSRRTDEFGVLQNALHGMAMQIRSLIDDIMVADRKRKEMEFRLLYEQINPHFIYNTMDIVYWEALSAGEDKLAELARTLTDYLRLSLNHGHELISVKNELEEVAKYIHIINYCYHDCVRLTVRAPAEVQDVMVINTILQPLVENAVFHGILAKEEPLGSIDIDVSLDGTNLTFIITDDGAGIDGHDIAPYLRPDSAHSGMRNVNNRIQAYYGPNCGITYEPNQSLGCRMTVRLDLSGAASFPSAETLLADSARKPNS